MIENRTADASKDITAVANETQDVDKNVDDKNEVNIKHGEEFGEELDALLVLEKVIAENWTLNMRNQR